jgi:hypothetical protein
MASRTVDQHESIRAGIELTDKKSERCGEGALGAMASLKFDHVSAKRAGGKDVPVGGPIQGTVVYDPNTGIETGGMRKLGFEFLQQTDNRGPVVPYRCQDVDFHNGRIAKGGTFKSRFHCGNRAELCLRITKPGYI